MDEDKVIGFYGGPLDGERIAVDTLPPVYQETVGGVVVQYAPTGGSHNLRNDPMVTTYTFIEP